MFYGKWNPKHWEKYPENSQILMLGKSIARDDKLHQNTTSSIQTGALFSFSTNSSLSGWRLSLLHIPTQHLSFLAISFVSFWVFLSMIVLLPFLLSFYKSFIFKFLRKNDVYESSKSNLPLTKNGGWNSGIVYSTLITSNILKHWLSSSGH